MNITNENALQAQREYQRAWRKANKDRVREYNRRYWERRLSKEASDCPSKIHTDLGDN